jgi:type II secretory pathway predicted ATPase ExeA/DNA repair exonuclease SbcCD ATPase subunit
VERSLEQPVADPTYLEFFGLRRPPFARLASPTQLFQTEQYALLMEHLVNTTTHADSLLVICGADGSGKTTLIDRYVKSLDDDVFSVVIDETCHGDLQFYSAFLTQIGFEDISGTASELRNITKEFLVCRGIAGDHVLLIIDNAHSTDPMILEQLRWLSEIKIKDRRVISVVLAGNADLVHVVNAPAMSGIKFENQVIFHIRSYSREETASYVWHSLRLAGGSDGVKISNEANLLIHRYSGGIPRQINGLCDDMLAEACRLETRVISEGVVRTVADKKGLLPHVIPLHGKGRRKTDPDFQSVKAVPTTGNTTIGGAAKTNKSIDESAPTTVDVGPEQLLKYVSKLTVQIEDLRADKVRALHDIDARNDDIIELRKQLDAQVKEIERLTRSLAANAEEITRQNLLLSSNSTALQVSQNRSIKLASDLEKEVRAKEAAQNELADATAAVAELNQQKLELQAALGDVQADLEAGIKVVDERALEIEVLEKNAADLKDELECRTGELDSLMSELALRDQALADLDARLEESQADCKSAEMRIAALDNPKELEEIEKAADKLAADLRKEKRAKKAATKELANSKATVDELNKRQIELQATVDEIQADLETGLKIAEERAARIEALEKRAVDLEKELEGRTGEADSLRDALTLRNEILADLEIRLDRSQSACELAQLRIAALKSPQEFEELEKAAEKLAVDLGTENLAREAAEGELAKAAASIEELSQLNAGLQATVDEARAECESAQLRIAVLKKPEELEEAQRASNKLAADLETECRAREAAEDALAQAAAAVEDLNRRNAELEATVDDTQADLEAGLKVAEERAREIEAFEKHTADLETEIEGKTGELALLREELKSVRDSLAARETDVAELDARLEDSRAEYESAKLRIAALKDPEELEEFEKRSNKLAADLRKERRAREATDTELARAVATVKEMGELERELRATVRNLNSDLREAVERAAEVHILEKEVTHLREEFEKKTRELDSRNKTLDDLEKRLEASQNECERLRRRASAVTIDEADVAKKAVTAPPRDARAYPSQVVAKFEQKISNISAYQTLKKHDSNFYDDLIVTYKQLVGLDLTDKQVNDALRAKQAKLIERLLPQTSDDAIVAYARLIVDQLDELRRDRTEPCLTLLIPPAGPDHTSPVYSEMTKGRELDILDIALRTYDADRPMPKEKDVWPDLGPIFDGLFDEFGADNVAAMENSYDPGVDRILVCKVTRALYSGILDLPKRKAANALRWLLST